VSDGLPWSKSQRGVILALLIAILIYLIIRLTLNPVYVSNPQPTTPPRANELEDRIDPNTADLPTLSTLPQMGEKRAQALIDYRQQFLAEHPGQVAFSQPQDLLRVKGIGVSMLEELEPFLIFHGDGPTTMR
jgi:DNA uptake protein ComE-like DNA-binding protein